MNHMDWTVNVMALVNLGVVLAGGLAAWWAFKSRVETILTNQKDILDKLSERFEKHEDTDRELFKGMQDAITRLVGDVSRLIGRYESTPVRRVTD